MKMEYFSGDVQTTGGGTRVPSRDVPLGHTTKVFLVTKGSVTSVGSLSTAVSWSIYVGGPSLGGTVSVSK